MRIVTWIAVGAVAGYLAPIQVRRMARDLGTRLSAAAESAATKGAPSVSRVKPDAAASPPA
jgi:hypothetical protein